ncbi:MAG: hypothetical protein Q27BPR15_19615 [Rhodobacter sp. CACIA14H1]|nr:MAG: hypothetical protein Q27BPR15_19615 [Rhodobacter sp. CACIA14H1]
MGLLTASGTFSSPSPLPEAAMAAAPEVTMLSQGLAVRIGEHPDDLCLIEELTIGDSIWDLATGRLVDLDGIACATLDGAQLAEMGLRPLPVRTEQGAGWFALASSRLLGDDPAAARLCPSPQVFFRFWAEARILAEVGGRAVRLRNL